MFAPELLTVDHYFCFQNISRPAPIFPPSNDSFEVSRLLQELYHHLALRFVPLLPTIDSARRVDSFNIYTLVAFLRWCCSKTRHHQILESFAFPRHASTLTDRPNVTYFFFKQSCFPCSKAKE